MVMSRLGFPVFDADNHLYETRDALTRHLPKDRRGTIEYVEVNGRLKIAVRGQISNYIPNPTFDRVGVPGIQADYFKHGNPEGKSYKEIIGRGIDCPDAFRNAEARLTLMNEQGLDYAMMLPTLASLVEERMRDDPDLAADVIHAMNMWLLDEWPYQYQNRIFTVPIITPGLVDRAVKELEFVLEKGAKAVLMRPAPAWGYRGPRSFAKPEFDPYWKLVEESGVLVVIHASDSGYVRYSNEWEGNTSETLPFGEPQLFSASIRNQHRDIQDAVTAVITHGVCWRFPKVRVALIENGAGWVPHLLHELDETCKKMPQLYPMTPTETFKRNFWMHPFHEENPRGLVELLGEDHVIFGSDYPHVEGLADPLSYIDEIRDLPEQTIRKIMGGNMLNLLGIDQTANV